MAEISLLNKSTLVTNSDAALMAAACAKQVVNHVAPAWGKLPMAVKFYANEAQVPAGAYRMYLLDDSDQAGALGYHAETPEGFPYGRVFAKPVLDNNGTMLQGTLTVASVVSHEVIELFCDPDVNAWYDGPGNKDYAAEACDPVEGDSYDVSVGLTMKKVSVSNFIIPAWFKVTPAKGETFDYLKKLSKPFTMTAGGYWIVRSHGAEQQVMAEYGLLFPEWKKVVKQHEAARSQKRISGIKFPG